MHPLPPRARALARRSLASLAVLCATATGARSQSLANYTPVRSTGVAYVTIAGTGTSVAQWRNGTNRDENRSEEIPIGFTFYYDGDAYKTFSVSTNGFIDFSSSTKNGAEPGPFGSSNPSFSSALSYTGPALAPFYEDLLVPAASSLANAVKYQTSGSPGSRVLTVEWIGVQRFGATSGSLNFQVKLFETGNIIQFNYGAMSSVGAVITYTCGINGPTMSNPPLTSQLLTQQTANTATFGATPQNALSTLPAANSRIQFTCVATSQPAPPTNINESSITQHTVHVTWTDNSTNETFFEVFFANDGVHFTKVGAVPSTTFNGTGTSYALDVDSLAAGTQYSIHVTANNEATPAASPLTGLFTTQPPGVFSVLIGNWGTGSTWSTGVVPTAADTVTIRNGYTVTLNVSPTILSLNVGQGSSGVLRFESASPHTITVNGDLNVRAGATFATALTGAQTGSIVNANGNLHCAGTLDFHTNAGANTARLLFNGNGDFALDGAGTVDLSSLTVALADTDQVLTVNPGTLTFNDTATPTSLTPVTLTRGTLHLAGSFPLTSPLLFSKIIGEATGFWLDNPNVSILPHPSLGLSLRGLLRLSQGTIQVGSAANEHLMHFVVPRHPRLIVEGGTLGVAGGVVQNGTSNLDFVQSGGTIEVCQQGNSGSATTFANGTTGTAELSGGVLVLVRSETGSANSDYSVNNLAVTPSTHVLRLGKAGVATSQFFRLVGSATRVEANNVGVAHNVQLSGFTARRGYFGSAPDTTRIVGTLEVYGDDFQSQGPLVLNVSAVLHLGHVFGASAELATTGIAPADLILGSSISGTLLTLDCDVPDGVAISIAAAETLVTRNLILRRGPVTHGGKLALGTPGFSSLITVMTGQLATAPIFLPAITFNLTYTGYTSPRAMGFEVPTGRSVGILTVEAPVAVAGGPIRCQSGLDIHAIVTTFPGQELDINHSVAITPPVGSPGASAGYVDGALIVRYTSPSPTGLQWFPVGGDSLYRPIGIQGVNTLGIARPCTLEVINHPSAATVTPPLGSVVQEVAYAVKPSAPFNSGARLFLSYHDVDAPWSVFAARVAGATQASGPYTDLGGTVTGGPREGTVQSTQDFGATQRFFRIGETTPSVRVVQPNGPALHPIGQVTTIAVQTFHSVEIARVDLYVSRTGNNGPWVPIATAQPDSEVYHWLVTGPESDDVFFRAVVKDTLQRFGLDVSDSAASIHVIAPAAVEDPELAGLSFAAPWPNPAAGLVRLGVTLPRAAEVRLSIHDLQGREVARIASGIETAGTHGWSWRVPRRLADGVYFARLAVEGHTRTRSFVLRR